MNIYLFIYFTIGFAIYLLVCLSKAGQREIDEYKEGLQETALSEAWGVGLLLFLVALFIIPFWLPYLLWGLYTILTYKK